MVFNPASAARARIFSGTLAGSAAARRQNRMNVDIVINQPLRHHLSLGFAPRRGCTLRPAGAASRMSGAVVDK